MELKNDNDHHEDQQSSVFHGEEFFVTRILAREASKGQSLRRAAEGIPFNWETNPGTPKNPREEDDDQIFPLCPSPLMQSLGLPLPSFEDHDRDHALKTSVISSLKRMVKENIIGSISKKVEKLGSRISKHQGSSMFGDSNGESAVSARCSSFSSFSTLSSNSHIMDTRTVDDPFCCDPSEIHAILDEGSTRIYYCSHHKTAFAVEEDSSFLSRIKSRVSCSDKFSGPSHAGIPFTWETHPPEDELIPPPPAVQEEAKTWKRVKFWKKGKKESEEVKVESNAEISRRDKEFESSFQRRSSSSNFSCSPWSGTDFLVLTIRKFKSYTS